MTMFRVCGALVLVATLTSGATAQTDEELKSRIAELEAKSRQDNDRIARLESRLGDLEADSGDAWLTRQRADEIRGLVEEVLADADTRTSLLGPPKAGYDDGAVISGGGGDWLLRTNLHMQQRFVFNSQSNSPSGDNTRWGFEVARAKFIMTGNVVSPQWFYKVEVELAGVNVGLPNGETRTGLLDAYLGYDLENGWRLSGGQFKTPLLREELVDSRYQLAVERSYVNYLYTGGRTGGFAVDYQGEKFHFIGSYNNGINDGLYGGGVVTGQSTSAVLTPTTDFAFTVRAEYLIQGEWEALYDFTSPKGSDTTMMVGGGLHFQTADNDAPGVPDMDLLVLTGDFSGEFSGWNVFGSVVYTNASPAAAPSINTLGVVVQGGYYFTDEWEGYARFEYSDLDTLSANDVGILTIGATRYFASHNAKWTTDFGVGFDGVPFTVPITDYRADAAGEDGQVVIRSQLQIVF